MDFGRLLSIWWSFFWRFTIATPVFGFVFGFLVAVGLRLAGKGSTPFEVQVLEGYLALAPASFWGIYATLKKHRLLPTPEDGDEGQPEGTRKEPRFDI